jgi:hypothetical protein
LSVQYDNARTERVGIARGCRDVRAHAQQPCPDREALASAAAGDDREFGREAGRDSSMSPCQPARRPDCGVFAIGHGDDLLVEPEHRCEQNGATVGSDQTERQHRPRDGIGNSRHRSIAASLKTGNANSVY